MVKIYPKIGSARCRRSALVNATVVSVFKKLLPLRTMMYSAIRNAGTYSKAVHLSRKWCHSVRTRVCHDRRKIYMNFPTYSILFCCEKQTGIPPLTPSCQLTKDCYKDGIKQRARKPVLLPQSLWNQRKSSHGVYLPFFILGGYCVIGIEFVGVKYSMEWMWILHHYKVYVPATQWR